MGKHSAPDDAAEPEETPVERTGRVGWPDPPAPGGGGLGWPGEEQAESGAGGVPGPPAAERRGWRRFFRLGSAA